jgi:hypothetical protein
MTNLTKLVDGVELPLDDADIALLEQMQAEAPAVQWAVIRTERNAKLAACDWTQLPDAPVDVAPWASYRQALRDITLQGDPFNITWPEQPS